MRPSRLSLALQAVVLSSLAAGVSAATVYTEVTEARQYTVEWSTDACECDSSRIGARNKGAEAARSSFFDLFCTHSPDNTTVQACWDWSWSAKDYMSSFSDVNIIYCEIDNPSSTSFRR